MVKERDIKIETLIDINKACENKLTQDISDLTNQINKRDEEIEKLNNTFKEYIKKDLN